MFSLANRICQKRPNVPYSTSYVNNAPTSPFPITLRDERIKESDEVRPGVIADFGYDGGIVRFEILQASKVVKNAREIQCAVSS